MTKSNNCDIIKSSKGVPIFLYQNMAVNEDEDLNRFFLATSTTASLLEGKIMKKCSKCKKTKLYSEFNKNIRSPDGYSWQCRQCKNEYFWGKQYCINCGKMLTGHRKSLYCQNCIKKGTLNPFYGKRFNHSQKTKKKLSLAKSGKNNPFYGKHLSERHKRKVSIARIKYLSSNNHRFKDTSIELKIKAELDKRNINYIQQYNAEGITCADFYLPEYKIIIQADGDYFHSKEMNKGRDITQDIQLIFKGYKIFRFWEHDINKSVKRCVNKIKEIRLTHQGEEGK